MKPFKLTLSASNDKDRIIFNSIIEVENLVELYSKLLLETAQLQVKLDEESRISHFDDDDIPF